MAACRARRLDCGHGKPALPALRLLPGKCACYFVRPLEAAGCGASKMLEGDCSQCARPHRMVLFVF